MRVIADFHLHSAYSRACSKELTLENNAKWCQKKGVNVLGTADFTHPKWFAELEAKLQEAEPGLYRLRSGEYGSMRYILTTEVSQIYKRGGQTRRVHNIILAPSLAAVTKLNTWLTESGFNIKADGRPILGLDSEELYKRLKDIDDRFVLIPAHAWTPWFSVFGSKSGFNSLEECFGEMTPFIYAIETGLSSDPLMNRSLSALDNIMLVSNSDAHSPRNFGREANVFEIPENELSFDEFIRIFRERDLSRFAYTIEFYPEEGKYHQDGHAVCDFWCSPEQTKKLGGRCPKCQKLLTVGVMSRVAELADRDVHEMPASQVPYKSIVPLEQILAEAYGVASPSSKKVQAMYDQLVAQVGTEFYLLLDAPIEQIEAASNPAVAEAVRRVRAGQMHIRPGFDGVFGKVKIFSEDDPPPRLTQSIMI
jgi:uncharacterized protein (TIGR00375 family)